MSPRHLLLLFLALPALLSAQTPASTPWTEPSNLAAADQAFEAKDYAGALRLYQALLQNAPSAGLFQRIGNCLYLSGDAAQALRAYRSSLQLEPSNAPLAKFVGTLQARLGPATPVPSEEDETKDKTDHRPAAPVKVRAFTLRMNLAALQVDIPAFNGDSAVYDVQAALLDGKATHPAGPPQGGLRLSLEPAWRFQRRWELGLEAGYLGLGRYEIHYAKIDTMDASYRITGTPVGPNLRWFFHIGPSGSQFYLLAGAAYTPVRMQYHREDQIGGLGVVQDGTLTSDHWGWHTGLGADLSLGGRWSIHPEFRWRQLRASNFKGDLTVTTTVGKLSQTKTDTYRLWQDNNNEIVSRKSGQAGDPGWSPLGLDLSGLETVVGVSYGF